MAVFEIPLGPESQIFNVSLNAIDYKFSLSWNPSSSAWNVDIYSSSGFLLVGGIEMVADTDLLEPYSNLNFGGQLIAQTDGEIGVNPTYDNLGIASHLYFITP